MQLSVVGCRQPGTLLLYTVRVGTGFGMKLACKSEYLHPQKQTTKLRLYISNWADWAKSATVSRSISPKLCLSNQTSLIISAVTLTSHFKICFCIKFFRNQVRHWLWQFSLYTLLSQLITADFFPQTPIIQMLRPWFERLPTTFRHPRIPAWRQVCFMAVFEFDRTTFSHRQILLFGFYLLCAYLHFWLHFYVQGKKTGFDYVNSTGLKWLFVL